jgi:putative phage-type endonuclease
MPRKVNLPQNSPEWLEWRRWHLGASDAPAIMFLDKFRGENSRHRLWLEKTGRVEERVFSAGTPAARGHQFEAVARERYCIDAGVFAPPVCLECTREGLDFMAASLDGLAGDKVVEFKCPNDARIHLDAREGHVPEAYWCQIQHQLFVSELELADYVSFFENELIVVPVKFDEAYVTNELVPAEREFWQWVQADTYPFPDDGAVLDLNEHPEILDRLQAYLAHRRKFEEMEELVRIDRAALMCKLAEVGRAQGLGATLHWERRKGYLNLRAVPAIAEFLRRVGPLDEYRAPDLLMFRVERAQPAVARKTAEDPEPDAEAG